MYDFVTHNGNEHRTSREIHRTPLSLDSLIYSYKVNLNAISNSFDYHKLTDDVFYSVRLLQIA